MSRSLRGEFETLIGGVPIRFDTKLGTIAQIEERCGDAGIVEIINRCVFGRRAKDQIALLSAALSAMGRDADTSDRLASAASVSEAEAFILALMGALGFEVATRRTEEAPPLDRASAGGAGASSPSAP